MPLATGSTLSLHVFIDALGWELLKRYGLWPQELVHRQPLNTVFGYSSTCDPTILTGLQPRDHGHFSCFVFDPARSPFRGLSWMRWLPGAIANRARVRGWLSRWVAHREGITGYFQLYQMPFDRLRWFDYTERRDLYQPGGIIGGQPTVFDRLREQGVPFYLGDWRCSEAQMLEGAHRALDGPPVRLMYLYLARLDHLLHMRGTDHELVRAHIRGYTQALESLVAHARKRYDRVQVYVFADHGMCNVVRTVDVRPSIDRLGLRFGEDYATVIDSTMVRAWPLNDRARRLLGESLAELGHGRLLSDVDLATWGCDFPGHRYGELFWLADAGVLICPSDMGSLPIAGMHGYAPDTCDCVAMLASNTAVPSTVRGLADLHDLMLESAGVPRPPRESVQERHSV